MIEKIKGREINNPPYHTIEMSGDQAKINELIDKVNGLEEAIRYLASSYYLDASDKEVQDKINDILK